MSLGGKHLLVTRPQHQAGDLKLMLEQRGARVSLLPLIHIYPPESWEGFDKAAAQLSTYDWIIFASVNAVEQTLARLAETGLALPSSLPVACIGPATRACLNEHKFDTSFSPSKFVAEAFVSEFPGSPDLVGKKILWTKTTAGRTLIADSLREAGAVVDVVYSYRTGGPPNIEAAADQLFALLDGGLDILILSSSEAVKNLKSLLDLRPQKEFTDVNLAAIGPETASSARTLLGRCEIEASEYHNAGLVAAIEDFYL